MKKGADLIVERHSGKMRLPYVYSSNSICAICVAFDRFIHFPSAYRSACVAVIAWSQTFTIVCRKCRLCGSNAGRIAPFHSAATRNRDDTSRCLRRIVLQPRPKIYDWLRRPASFQSIGF